MFKITITQTREVKKIVGKEWEVVDTEEVHRDNDCILQGEPRTRVKDVHGYTPEIEKTLIEERTILIQEVETLDLAAVIKAINGL